MDFFGRKKREAKRLVEQQHREQEKIFKEFVVVVSDSVNKANNSKKFKRFRNGNVAEGIGNMKYFLVNKGKSIVVVVEDKTATHPPAVCQIDINVAENRIYIILGGFCVSPKKKIK